MKDTKKSSQEYGNHTSQVREPVDPVVKDISKSWPEASAGVGTTKKHK